MSKPNTVIGGANYQNIYIKIYKTEAIFLNNKN